MEGKKGKVCRVKKGKEEKTLRSIGREGKGSDCISWLFGRSIDLFVWKRLFLHCCLPAEHVAAFVFLLQFGIRPSGQSLLFCFFLFHLTLSCPISRSFAVCLFVFTPPLALSCLVLSCLVLLLRPRACVSQFSEAKLGRDLSGEGGRG